MNRFIKFITEKRLLIIIVFAALSVISAFLLPYTKVNYDSTKYLPNDTLTAKGLEILHKEFGNNGTVSVMVKDISIADSLKFKKKIEDIGGVKEVIWLDDIFLPYKPAEMTEEMFWANFDTVKQSLPAEIQAAAEGYYNKDALFYVVTQGTDSDEITTKAIKEIDKLGKVHLSGPAATAYNNVNVTMNETLRATLIILPIIIIILLLATNSYIEPLLFMIIIGVSILLNMGTNAIFGEISYLTQSTAAILQMALSMDYLIFLLSRFRQEKEKNPDIVKAMGEAVKKSFAPIAASSLTTIAGFVALMFMRYRIGFDMGIVLSKGILFSLFTVFLLMPALTLVFDKIIEKTAHKHFEIKFKSFGNFLKRTRFILPFILIAVMIPAAFAQGKTSYLYGDSATMGGEGSRLMEDRIATEQSFGVKNTVVVLAPVNQANKELNLSLELMSLDSVTSVNSYSLAAAQAASLGQSLPDSAVKQFMGDNFFRIILNIDAPEEGEKSAEAIAEIDKAADKNLDGYYILGASPGVLDIKNVIENDYSVVSLISIGLVALIVMLTFKSLVLPLLVILTIQGSVWINMAFPYIMNEPVIFIGCMIVSCIQLGATIDYGILLSSRYLEFRKTENKFSAILKALSVSSHSIIISSGILCAAGFTLMLTSSMPGVSVLGTLIGRGALISALMVLILLPQLLMLFDKGVKYTTIKGGFFKDK